MLSLSRSSASLKHLCLNSHYVVVAETGRKGIRKTTPSAAFFSSISSTFLSQNSQSPSSFPQEHRKRNPSNLPSVGIRRSYFTNAKVTKDKDPYAILGLQWGDGATTSEIKAAFRSKAQELHPDLNTTDTPEQAQLNFQNLVKAYETLVPLKDANASASDKCLEDWRVTIWRQGDRIAMDRTDVAGQARARPAPPARTSNHKYHSRELGHPQGAHVKRGEYLAAGNTSGSSKRKSSSVGTGRNKWVKPKAFKAWNPDESNEIINVK